MTEIQNYQKTGYLTGDFRIFHLKDSSGPDFSYHYHSFDKILILLSGNVSYRIEGRSYRLAPYDVVFVRHNDIHKPEVDFSVPYERIIAYIAPGFLAAQTAGETGNEGTGTEDAGNGDLSLCFARMKASGSDVFRLEAGSPVMPAVSALAASLSDTGYAHALYSRLIFLEFMVLLNRAVLKNQAAYPEASGSNPRIQELLAYVNTHLGEDLSVELLAGKFYFSRYHLMRTFKKETGCTLAGYIQEKRLLMARERIQSGVPAMEAAMECGYRDYSAFAKAFRHKFQAPPSHFGPDSHFNLDSDFGSDSRLDPDSHFDLDSRL